jgi:PAS domain S-box-containing protein
MKQRNNILISATLATLTALALWAGDAAVNALVFRRGAFIDLLLFGLPAHELYSRSLSLVILLLFCAVISRTTRKRCLAQEALRESEATLRSVTDAAHDAIIVMDHQGAITFWNPAAEKIFGYTAEEANGNELYALLAPPRFHERYRKGFRKFQAAGESPAIGRTLELTARRKDGAEFPIELSLSALRLKGSWYAVGILRDIGERRSAEEELREHRGQLEKLVGQRTGELNAVNELLRKEILDRKRTEEELSRSETFLSTIFDSFHDPLRIVDRECRIIKVNDAYTRTRGRKASKLVGRKCYEIQILQNKDCVCSECLVDKTFQSKDPCSKEKLFTLPDGSQAWAEVYTYPIYDPGRNVTHVVEFARDITDRKKEEEEKKLLIKNLNYLSTTDGLTGLLNRRALNDMLRHEIERAGRYNADLSVLLCDVDKFKAINDTYGHPVGDAVLCETSSSVNLAPSLVVSTRTVPSVLPSPLVIVVLAKAGGFFILRKFY